MKIRLKSNLPQLKHMPWNCTCPDCGHTPLEPRKSWLISALQCWGVNCWNKYETDQRVNLITVHHRKGVVSDILLARCANARSFDCQRLSVFGLEGPGSVSIDDGVPWNQRPSLAMARTSRRMSRVSQILGPGDAQGSWHFSCCTEGYFSLFQMVGILGCWQI